ncbi:hypothetical protein PLESTM_000485700 [Pleodorina starrii]|nr:hypothetical protein PLESTM_000485700 [Pleodorina starrii]
MQLRVHYTSRCVALRFAAVLGDGAPDRTLGVTGTMRGDRWRREAELVTSRRDRVSERGRVAPGETWQGVVTCWRAASCMLWSRQGRAGPVSHFDRRYIPVLAVLRAARRRFIDGWGGGGARVWGGEGSMPFITILPLPLSVPATAAAPAAAAAVHGGSPERKDTRQRPEREAGGGGGRKELVDWLHRDVGWKAEDAPRGTAGRAGGAGRDLSMRAGRCGRQSCPRTIAGTETCKLRAGCMDGCTTVRMYTIVDRAAATRPPLCLLSFLPREKRPSHGAPGAASHRPAAARRITTTAAATMSAPVALPPAASPAAFSSTAITTGPLFLCRFPAYRIYVYQPVTRLPFVGRHTSITSAVGSAPHRCNPAATLFSCQDLILLL